MNIHANSILCQCSLQVYHERHIQLFQTSLSNWLAFSKGVCEQLWLYRVYISTLTISMCSTIKPKTSVDKRIKVHTDFSQMLASLLLNLFYWSHQIRTQKTTVSDELDRSLWCTSIENYAVHNYINKSGEVQTPYFPTYSFKRGLVWFWRHALTEKWLPTYRRVRA